MEHQNLSFQCCLNDLKVEQSVHVTISSLQCTRVLYTQGMTAVCSPKSLSKSLIHHQYPADRATDCPHYGQGKPRGNPGASEVVTRDVDEGEGGVSVCSGNGSGWGRRGSAIDWSKYINPAIINLHEFEFLCSGCTIMCTYHSDG